MFDDRTSTTTLWGAFAVVVLVACSSSSNEAEPTLPQNGVAPTDAGVAPSSVKTTTGLPCEVSQILSANCQTCHGASPQAGASTSLVTWEDLQRDHGGKRLYEVVKDRIHAETQPMPPATRLTAAQLKSIDDWVAAGAPEANATCDVGQGPPPATQPFECPAPAQTTILKAAKPFKWDTSATDQYVCFGVDDIVKAKRHAIAFGPKVENLDIVHHILLFQTNSAVSNEASPCASTASASWKLVTGWAPGGGNFELPPEAGVPQEATTHWVVQIHYNNASGKFNGATDNSGYQVCSTDQLRPNDAGIIAFGSINFSIPPRTAKHRIKCDYKLDKKYNGVTFFRAWPHMHTQGMAMATERFVAGQGTPEPVYSQDPFSFENQESHPINTKVASGDVMRTRCTWKNTTDLTVGWGEKTGDEMCFNFLSYYPAIPDVAFGPLPVQTWVTPSFQASCTVDNE